jgi:hypothetical protein
VNRGLAYPSEEPWASFAVDYCRAERGIAGAIQETAAMKVQLLHEQMEARLKWADRPPPPPRPSPPDKPGRKATDEQRDAYKAAKAAHEQEMLAWELAMEGWRTPPPSPDVDELMWMERHRIGRFPEDYGTSKHRRPEPAFDAQEFLDAHAMEREQLAALFTDPPDSIRAALVDAAPAVYAILVAGGFDHTAPAKQQAHDEDA